MLAFARITNTATQAVANQLTVSGQMSAATNQRIQASLRASNASIKNAASAVKQQKQLRLLLMLVINKQQLKMLQYSLYKVKAKQQLLVVVDCRQ